MEEYEIVKKKAEWCLQCKTKPCSLACPMHTKIPEFIKQIKENNLKEAYQILIENNLLSHICGLVCPVESQCEGSCTRGIRWTPVEIAKMETYVNKWAEENNIKPEFHQSQEIKGVKVAIIGSGPASLSCSFELAKKGIKSVIFEKEESLGGLLDYGIPDFRLDRKIVNKVIENLKNLGVEFKLGQELGRNISIKDLKKEYDYIFVGIGAEISSMYKLSDEKLDSVYDSDTFLRAYNSKNYLKNLGEVIVIGGGNVAMDSARAAVRMGASKVSILYRRDKAHMPARPIELEEALEEKVQWVPLTRVVSANLENGKMVSVHCNRTQIVNEKAQDVLGEEFDYKADTVVFAIGLKPNKELIQKEGFEMTDWGTIKVDEKNETSIENVFSGGDVTENKSVVCKALASGKNATEGIYSKINK